MATFNWENFTKELRGIGLIVAGSILLFHTLGILQKWLNWFLVFFALVLIVYGLMETGVWRQVIALIKKPKQPNQE